MIFGGACLIDALSHRASVPYVTMRTRPFFRCTTTRAGSEPGYRIDVVAQSPSQTTWSETMTPEEPSAALIASAISARVGQLPEVGDCDAGGDDAADDAMVAGALGLAVMGRPVLSPRFVSEWQAVSVPAHATTAKTTADRNNDMRPPSENLIGLESVGFYTGNIAQPL